MPSGRTCDEPPRRDTEAGESLAPVIRLRPVRTLVLSPDLAYRRRALTVLSDLGPVSFAPAAPAHADAVAALLLHEQPDVVLVDATDCEAAARELIATLTETAPRAGIVVVCQHCVGAALDLRALPKWGWTQDLRAAVEAADREGNPLRRGTLGSLRRRSPWHRMAGPLLRRG
jgi:CheY-like chemotaxis protein